MGEKIKNVFKSMVFDGVVLILVGIVLLLWPDDTMDLIFKIMGGVCAVVGLVHCIIFFTRKPEQRNIVDLIIGIVQIALGIVMLVKSDFFRSFFYLVIGVLAVYICILMAIQFFRISKTEDKIRHTAALIFGLVLLALAVVVFINPKELIGSFVIRLHGISMIVSGLSLIFVMSQKKEKKG